MLKALLCLLLLITSALAYPIRVVEVEWSSTPNSTPAARNLNSPYLGECVCDITRGSCDPLCCCDEDCDVTARAAFSFCLPETYGTPYLDYCYRETRVTSLQRLNNLDRSYIAKKPPGHNAVCIIRTNHPSELYGYFRVPTNVMQPPLPTTSTSEATAGKPYSLGDPLTTAKYVLIEGSAAYRRVAPIQLPTTTSDGSCSTIGRSVRFLDSIKGTSCVLNGAQICALFPLAKYMNLFLHPMLGRNSSAPDFVPVTLNVHDASGALLEAIDPSALPATTIYVTKSDGKTCNNAIVGWRARFSHSSIASGRLAEAAINITLGNLGLNQYAALLFEAAFTSANASVPRNIFAATPGYLSGDKVRAGTFITAGDKGAILERESGFAVPGGGRLCSSDEWKRASFLYSIFSSGCLLLMNESDLQKRCNAGTGDLLTGLINVTVSGTPTILDRIGMTNDALINDTTSWIPITGLSDALTSSAGIYDPHARQCINISVGLHYQFVIARAGAVYNPQDIIAGAFASPILGTLRITNETDFSEAAQSHQQFSFQVSFSRYDRNSQEKIMRKVVAPPILPHIDDTVFYPFRSPFSR
ncbi:hypothetical protein LSCM1_00392 [Leishmania martiniquensis]|uniref:Tectonic-1-3 N-terminal domain-containing protein n=1 Tax=Leishmania martiniquensis TaxID=1580590 RepID=A0A836K9T4_9TRYP|nr:hypothetical protein LSCM1_00392 [Leishmania martiniquensis]